MPFFGSVKCVIVIVSGLPGSGKSTLVERLAEEFNLKKVFASGLLRQLRESQRANFERAGKGSGFWESGEGRAFTKKRLEELDFDRRLDEELQRIAKAEKNVIFDSRTMPWLYKGDAFRIWLKASERVRAERIAKRDGKKADEIIASMKKRYEADKKIYKKLYGFELGEDFTPFQLIIDSNELSESEVFNIARLAVKKYFGL